MNSGPVEPFYFGVIGPGDAARGGSGRSPRQRLTRPIDTNANGDSPAKACRQIAVPVGV